MEIDPITGLPKELGIIEEISKENLQVTVSMAKKKFGKKYTIIEGVADQGIDIKDLTKALKQKFATGGSFKGNTIELQGDHRTKIKDVLTEFGFRPENIEILADSFKGKRR